MPIYEKPWKDCSILEILRQQMFVTYIIARFEKLCQTHNIHKSTAQATADFQPNTQTQQKQNDNDNNNGDDDNGNRSCYQYFLVASQLSDYGSYGCVSYSSIQQLNFIWCLYFWKGKYTKSLFLFTLSNPTACLSNEVHRKLSSHSHMLCFSGHMVRQALVHCSFYQIYQVIIALHIVQPEIMSVSSHRPLVYLSRRKHDMLPCTGFQ